MNRSLLPHKPFGLFGVLVIVMLLMAACQPAVTPAPTLGANTAPEASATSTMAPVAAATTAATEPAAVTETAMVPETGGNAAASEAALAVAEDPQLGPILVDGEGMTLYMFTKDEANKSNCAGGCLEAWPPLLTQGSPMAGEGVDESLIGTAEMPDGSMIVTYNEMPLYYWQADTQPGQATGQGVNDVWYVVSPEGEAVGMPAMSDADAVILNMAADPVLGDILVDSEGMTLYMFTKDEPNKSNCEGGCLEAWPPFTAEGEVTAGEGVDQDLIGTAEMPDGSMIVTYNEMPLYYWQADTQPGQTTGQGVNDVWYVVSPEGEAVGRP